ncbi:MAG: PAS domain-containing protein [Aestuariivirgaceae bacterium]|jgi:hypothetical protein
MRHRLVGGDEVPHGMNLIESETPIPVPTLPDLLHPGSRALFRHWETIRGERSVPSRSDLDLRKITEIVPWLFILERNPVRQAYRWRLAGTGIGLLWGRELTGGGFLDEWRPHERAGFGAILDRVVAALQPCIAHAHAMSIDGDWVKLELLGVPIRTTAGNQVQILGAVLPLENPRWLGHASLDSLSLQSAKLIWTEPIPGAPAGLLPSSPPSTSEAALTAFTVIQGGKRDR